jgi:amidase
MGGRWSDQRIGPRIGVGASGGNVGAETSGSILGRRTRTCWRDRPTVRRISRCSVIPICRPDTPGPMARHVMDVAIMFGALEGVAG